MNSLIVRLMAQAAQLATKNRNFVPTRAISPTQVQRLGRNLINFASSDYLNLSWQPSLSRAVVQAIELESRAFQSSRLSAGTSEAHLRAEARLAQFLGTESALLMSSRSQACISLLSVLLNESDTLFFSDQSESPLSDLALLLACKTASLSFKFSNLEHIASKNLRVAIFDCNTPFRDLQAANEAAYLVLKRQYDFMVVDETYALIGTGIRGAGLHEALFFLGGDYCLYGDLGASLPLSAGFVAGPKLIIEQIQSRSRVLNLESTFASYLPAMLVQALDIAEAMSSERLLLAAKRDYLGTAIANILGTSVSWNIYSPCVQISFNSVVAAEDLFDCLLEQGVLVDIVNYSGMGERHVILRLFVNLAHTDSDFTKVLEALRSYVQRANMLK